MKIYIKIIMLSLIIYALCFGKVFAASPTTTEDITNKFQQYNAGPTSFDYWDFGRKSTYNTPEDPEDGNSKYVKVPFDPTMWVDRHMNGLWTFEDSSVWSRGLPGHGGKYSLGYGPDPGPLPGIYPGGKVTIVEEYTPSSFGYDDSTAIFTGWTRIPNSGPCNRTNKELAMHFYSSDPDIAKMYNYTKTDKWINSWDFWWDGWNGRPGISATGGWHGYESDGEVHIQILDDGKRMKIYRSVSFSSKGYCNAPAAAVTTKYTIGNEWKGRFGGGTPETTPVNAPVVNGNVEHRVYNMGEFVYVLIGNANDIAVTNFNPVSPNNTRPFGTNSISISADISAKGSPFTNVPATVTITGPGGNQVYTSSRVIETLTPEAPITWTVNAMGFASVGKYKVTFSANSPPTINETSNYYDNNILTGYITIYNIPTVVESTGNHMILAATLEELNENDITNKDGFLIDRNNYKGSESNPLKIKSGYGIPVTAEIQGFYYVVEHYCDCCCDSAYRSFNIDMNTSTISIDVSSVDGTPVNSYWYNSPPAISGIKTLNQFYSIFSPTYESGADSDHPNRTRLRASVKHQTGAFPRGYRKIYLHPGQADGLYKITVTSVAHTSWEERVWECEPCSDCGDDCDACCSSCDDDWVPQSPTYTDTVDLYVQIQDSMFDDDHTVITQ